MSSDPCPLPEAHPRTSVVNQADLELMEFTNKWITRHKLTRSEYLMIFSNMMTQDLKACVNTERRKS